MDKILNSINTRLTYIRSNSSNTYILKQCDIIDEKLDEIRNKKYETSEMVNQVCDNIINRDISLMKRVAGETNMVYKKMDELAGFIDELKTLYFE